ncbi:GNAT family protein [Brevibacillus choshinensis]|uniref:GNAT family N-acetyltransferase n=1 Tax=Brevibacillus choshinensis TaxID=54911 RepID=UPI002E252034|nr:GNAT family protein [Brevibacillus choshinensis]
MLINITPLRMEDAIELYQFESSNRAFFEKMVPSRGEDYYRYEHFLQSLEQLLEEQEAGLSLFTLIRDEAGMIVGRMNVVDMDREKGTGHIGYRVGEAVAGKGVASLALTLLLKEAAERYGMTKLYAKTTRDNIPSQKVLLKHGFELVSVEPDAAEWDGKKEDFLHYQKRTAAPSLFEADCL